MAKYSMCGMPRVHVTLVVEKVLVHSQHPSKVVCAEAEEAVTNRFVFAFRRFYMMCQLRWQRELGVLK